MRLRTLLLALALSTGLATAASRHPKPPKVARHVKGHKAAKHPGPAVKPMKHKGQKAGKHSSGPKLAKHKGPKAHRHKA